MHPHDDHAHDHDDSSHSHTHGLIDPTISTTKRGVWAIKWSFSGLFLTSLLQIVIVMFTGSVALLADTIHIDPVGASGEASHGIENHAHDDLEEHSHA
jgi:Co/Zn/Cd efflux system component